MVSNLLGLLDPVPAIHVEAPDTVEATFWSNPGENQIIIQLLNKTHMDSLIPVDGITIQIRKDVAQPKHAYLPWPSKKDLELQERELTTDIPVPRMGLHEVVIVEY